MVAALTLHLDGDAGELLLLTLAPRLWTTARAEMLEIGPGALSPPVSDVLASAWQVQWRGPAWSLRRGRSPYAQEQMTEAQERVWTRVARLAAIEDLDVLVPGSTLAFRRMDVTARWTWSVTVCLAAPAERAA